MKRFLILICFLVVACITITGQIIHVPADFSTIQGGIDAAQNGDTVLVDDGTYLENINFKGKAITVASNFILDGDTNYINNTIIDGSQPSNPDSGSVVYFKSGEDTTSILCGFTITGGTGTYYPPGVLPVPIRIGGGILCFNSAATIKNNKIKYNSLEIGLPDAFTMGGGIFCGPPNPGLFTIIKKNIIYGNSILTAGSASNWQLSWAQGGGIALYTDGLVVNNEISSNQCKSIYGYSVGGGIRLNGGTTKIFKNNIDLNSSISVNSRAFAGGISCSAANAIIESDTITNNFIAGALVCNGTAIYFDLYNDANWAVVKNNYIAGNYYTNGICFGGAIGMYRSSPDIYNNVITSNSADYGGAFSVVDTSRPKIINNTITNNIANQEGGALYTENPTTQVLLINSILWNNGTEIYQNSGEVSVYYSDIEGGWTGTGSNNINADPFFADPAYNLADSSLCIGAGIDSIDINGIWYYAPLFDIDGDIRPDPPGSIPDMGAQESPLCCPPTTINIHPKVLNFGDVAIDTFAIMTFTLTNTGNTDLVITDISSNEPAFNVNISGDTIPPQTNQDVEVTFTPTGAFSFNGIIEITHNALGNSDTVMVTGEGVPVTGIEYELLNTIPTNFVLYQNYPNPFNPMTSIIFGLPEASKVKLTLFNFLGEEVTNLFVGYKNAGYHQIEFDASRLPSGIYFYRLLAGDFIETRKMILLK